MRSVCAPALALIYLLAPEAATSQPRSIIIVSPSADDRRIAATGEAVAFWNQTLEGLGIEALLAEPTVEVQSKATRALENYARVIWQLAGRLPPGSNEWSDDDQDSRPRAPDELIDIEADIVVLLSVQELMPFAWPFDRGPRYFVAIDRLEPEPSPQRPPQRHRSRARPHGRPRAQRRSQRSDVSSMQHLEAA